MASFGIQGSKALGPNSQRKITQRETLITVQRNARISGSKTPNIPDELLSHRQQTIDMDWAACSSMARSIRGRQVITRSAAVDAPTTSPYTSIATGKDKLSSIPPLSHCAYVPSSSPTTPEDRACSRQLRDHHPDPRTGSPSPLGPSKQGSAVNFALYAKFATGVEICLFDGTDHRALASIKLDPKSHKSGAKALTAVIVESLLFGTSGKQCMKSIK